MAAFLFTDLYNQSQVMSSETALSCLDKTLMLIKSLNIKAGATVVELETVTVISPMISGRSHLGAKRTYNSDLGAIKYNSFDVFRTSP